LEIDPMALSETIKTLINNAWVDGYPCMLATAGKDGPNISPKGSMVVYAIDISPIGNGRRRRPWRISRTIAASW
jgi:hypothetical protein